jgi:glycosyltransferase involved in cell wall biosynthesis
MCADRSPLDRLGYAAVTPARDEEENLARLADSLLAQTVRPVRWVIVENGSRDSTADLTRGLAAEHDWISLVQTQAGDGYDRTSPYMRAWHRGVEELHGAGDLVVKLDADVSMEPDYFEGVIAAFEHNPELGIASGTLFERRRGAWEEIVLLVAAHYTGYRFSYLAARSLYRAVRDPASIGLLSGYLGAALRRAPQHDDDEVIAALRRSQRVRNLAGIVRSRLA